MSADRHKLFRIKAKVIDQTNGVIRMIEMADGSPLSAEMRSTSEEFANRRFTSFARGQLVVATFRISPTGRRYLLSVRNVDDAEKTTLGGKQVSVEQPMTVDGYYFSSEIRRTFRLADKAARSAGVFVLLMIGPSGYGKTTIPMKFAEKTGRRFVRVNCSAIRDPEEWLGFREARSGDTIFEPTEFAIALTEGNSVIVLDEVNRIEPWLHNTLFPLLDFSRRTVVHNKEFEVGKNTVIAMTMNRGIEYVGTFELDQAFVNRADAIIRVGPPPKSEEIKILLQRTDLKQAVAEKVISTLGMIRDAVTRQETIVDSSTRAALKVAALVSHGAPIREAFHHTIELSASGEDMKKVTDILNSTLGITAADYMPEANDDLFAKKQA